jgi:hypothetical protein
MASVLALLRLPLRLARAPVDLALLAAGAGRRRALRLPVAGLDAARAQDVLFLLRRAAAAAPGEAEAAREWLAALQAATAAQLRLLAELDDVEAQLAFWARRLRRGGHFWFALFRHGPAAFGRRAGAAAARLLGRGGAPGRLRAGGAAAAAAGGDAEQVERRVMVLRLLRGALAEALAAVEAAGARLHLGAAGGAADGRAVLAAARAAARGSLLDVAAARGALDAAVADAAASAAAPLPGGDAPAIVAALGRALGLAAGRRGAAAAPPPPLEPPPVPAAAAGSFAAALGAAQRAAGAAPRLAPGATADAALAAARGAAAQAVRAGPRLAPVPDWARAPSAAQQNWLQLAAGGAAAAYAALFLARHSRLGGSRDLEDWSRAGASAARAAWREHVVGPLDKVRGELFSTFRARPAIVSLGEYEADRDSLARMLDAFARDHARRGGGKGGGGKGAPPAAAPAAAPGALPALAAAATGARADAGIAGAAGAAAGDTHPGMELMMRRYEAELRSPLRGLVGGDLARCLLIQVQKLKVDTESAMLEMDQVLKANELSISLVAAVPAFLLAGAVLAGLGRLVTPAPPDPRREAVRARVAMLEAERALEALAAAEAAGSGAAEARGLFTHRLAAAYAEAEALYRRHRGLLRAQGGEWPALRADLLALASPAPAEARRASAARVMRSYSIYQQAM